MANILSKYSYIRLPAYSPGIPKCQKPMMSASHMSTPSYIVSVFVPVVQNSWNTYQFCRRTFREMRRNEIETICKTALSANVDHDLKNLNCYSSAIKLKICRSTVTHPSRYRIPIHSLCLNRRRVVALIHLAVVGVKMGRRDNFLSMDQSKSLKPKEKHIFESPSSTKSLPFRLLLDISPRRKWDTFENEVYCLRLPFPWETSFC